MAHVNLRHLVVLFCAGLGVPSCKPLTISSENLSCLEKRCAPGYVCHPQNNLCVKPVAVGCDQPDAFCPARIHAGDQCTVYGSFIPCLGQSVNCEHGCRTCSLQGQWSSCQVSRQCNADVPAEICAARSHGTTQEPTLLMGPTCIGGAVMKSPDGRQTLVSCMSQVNVQTPRLSWRPGVINLQTDR